jgi:hypothetical protein
MSEERQLAVNLIKVLDGIPINKARLALEHAIGLLSDTQVVSAESPLLDTEDKPSGF